MRIGILTGGGDVPGLNAAIRAAARRLDPHAWQGHLYRPGGTTRPAAVPAAITAVPYCLWANRQPGEMTVWIRESAPEPGEKT